MKLPDSWTSLPLSRQDLGMYVNTAIYEKGHCDSLTDWANVVENIVDLAVQADFQKHTGTVVFSSLILF